jgi:hypothetical protein
MAAQLGQRIQDIVGFDYASNSINSEDEALEVACAEVIDLAPVSLLLKYAVAPTDLVDGAANMDIGGKKVLRVIRFDSNGNAKICEKLDIDEFKMIALDTHSIYKSTKYSPVYAEDPETGTTKLEVRPVPTGGADAANSAKVYYITYPTGSAIDASGDSSPIAGIPNELEHAIALRASMYILTTMISDAVQDDEDSELQSMLNAQLEVVNGMYQSELTKITGDNGEQTAE